MVKARAFFFVCAGLFLLAASYHFGARNAGAQAPSNPVVASFYPVGPPYFVIVTANGDVYGANSTAGPWALLSNVFTGVPTPVQQDTWGALKVRYRGERGAAQPAPQDR